MNGVGVGTEVESLTSLGTFRCQIGLLGNTLTRYRYMVDRDLYYKHKSANVISITQPLVSLLFIS
jgi:hypothetical protein